LSAGTSWGLKDDWDWHRLLRQCAKGSALDEELRRLLTKEGFVVSVMGGAGTVRFDARTYTSALRVRNAAKKCPPRDWAGFNVYYPMPESEVRASSGYELVKAVEGVFAQLVRAMNFCMQVPLEGTPAGR
jgi:hypothetical protein